MRIRILYDTESNGQKVKAGEEYYAQPVTTWRGRGVEITDNPRKGFYLYPWEYKEIDDTPW